MTTTVACTPDRSAELWFKAFIDRSQVIAGQMPLRTCPPQLLETLSALFDDLPGRPRLPQILHAHAVSMRLLARVIIRAGVAVDPPMIDVLNTLFLCDAVDSLRRDWRAAIQSVGRHIAAKQPTAPLPGLRDRRIQEAVRAIEERHSDANLTLREVAGAVGLSPWHLTRLMRRQLGQSFSTHLHTIRVEAAERLLVSTRLSIKQIAGTVGYSNSTQLDRHFRLARGITPSALRRDCVEHKWMTKSNG